MKNIETKQLELAKPDPAAIVFVFKAGAFRYQRTITYNISPSSSLTNQNAGSGERRKWGSWMWHRCCDFPRITTSAHSSNENGGKVIMRGVRQAETAGKSLWRDINLEAWEKIFMRPKWNGLWTLRYGFISYTFITGWTTTNVMDYIEFRVPVNWMIEAMCVPFFKVWVNEMCNFKIWFHSTGLAPEGDIFLSVTFPENSSLI